MSKNSIASAPKNPTAKSAWSRGPPQSSSTAPSPRSQSPAPSTPVLQSHSRRPSVLGQVIPIKDRVSILRNNVGAVKQGSAVTFGSIDDVSVPIFSSPAAIPPTKSEGVKTFGSVPVATATGHVNGEPSISSRASVVPPTALTSSAASSSALSAATPPARPKIDIKTMFKNPSSNLPTTGLSSPRLASHPHNPQSSTMPPPPPQQMQPQMQPQMQHLWYYQYPPSDLPHFMSHYQQWYNPMQMPPQHQPPPHQPHPGSQTLHTGLPTSPQNSPSVIQGPSTPTLSHTTASPVHPPPHLPALAHPSNSLGLTSPPPTPSTPSLSAANRLDVGSRTFVPRAAAKLTIKKADGTEVSLENLIKNTPPATAVPSPPNTVLRQGSPGTPNRGPTSVRMETEDQHKSWLAEQEQNDKVKTEAADKVKKEKEKTEAERKAKVAEEIRNLEVVALLRNEYQKKKKELRRKQEEERIRKEAEALELQRLKRRLKLQLAQERAKEEKEWNEKEEREAQERLSKLAEEARLRLEEGEEGELEAHKGYGKQDGQLEDGKDVDTETSKSMENGKDKPKDGLRIKSTSITTPTFDRRLPGPLDLTGATGAIRSASSFAISLATARFIADIATVPYPEGYRRPHPDLNQNVKNGKFRYDREFLLQFMSVCKKRPATLPLDAIGLEPDVDYTHAMSRGGPGHHRPSRQASIGLGFTPSALGKSGTNNLFGMGNFGTMGTGSKLSSEERYANSNRAASVSGAPGMRYTSNRPSTMQGTAGQGGASTSLQKHGDVRQMQPQPTDIAEKFMTIHDLA